MRSVCRYQPSPTSPCRRSEVSLLDQARRNGSVRSVCAPVRCVFEAASGVTGIDGFVNLVDPIRQFVVIDL
jgi:hypothetical protein